MFEYIDAAMHRIETARLRLRPLEQRDLPRLVELLNEWDVTKWLVRVPYPYTEDDAKWWYDKAQEDVKTGKDVVFVIADKQDDVLIGGLGFHENDETKPSEREIGYWLGKPYWGQGYMSEAVAAALPFIFERPGIVKITSFTDPDNLASQNVLRKAGLRYLGIHPRPGENFLRGSDKVTRWEKTADKDGRTAAITSDKV